jgi:hypothetical protein
MVLKTFNRLVVALSNWYFVIRQHQILGLYGGLGIPVVTKCTLRAPSKRV